LLDVGGGTLDVRKQGKREIIYPSCAYAGTVTDILSVIRNSEAWHW